MKKVLFILLLPLFTLSQDDCGERPIKPEKIGNQTNQEYKSSKEYLAYKKILKQWKHCMSPLGISEKLNDALEQKSSKESAQIVNLCGDKPERPKRKNNQSIDEYRKGPNFITYRQKLKDWKSCMSPINDLKSSKLKNVKNTIKIKPEDVNPCGSKPLKPTRAEGLNHEEYRQTASHIAYRQQLKDWRSCIKNNAKKL